VGRPDRPLDPAAGALPRFAYDLRQLRRLGGRPTYRELAKRAHYSTSTLAEAASGVRLPTLEVTLAYVAACGGDLDEWRDRWQALADDRAAGADGADGAEGPATGTPASAAAAAAQPGAVRAAAPRRYWRYPAAALTLLAVAAANFVLGQRTAYDAVAHRRPAAVADPALAAGLQPPQAAAGAAPVESAASAGSSGGGRLRYGFEDSVAPWAAAWNATNLHADVDAGLADTGHSSLRLRVAPDPAAPPAIGTDQVAGLRPGAMVTVRIYHAGQGSGRVRPYVQDAGGGIDWTATAPLTLSGSGWTTYAWQVPDAAVRRLGLELDNTGADGLVIALDTVVW
jgi:transcriptional regulator with XRE-family HTH domain